MLDCIAFFCTDDWILSLSVSYLEPRYIEKNDDDNNDNGIGCLQTQRNL